MFALSAAGLYHTVILKQNFSFNNTLKNLNWKNTEFSPDFITLVRFCHISLQKEQKNLLDSTSSNNFRFRDWTAKYV